MATVLARKFGREHLRQTDSGQVREAFRALKATLEGFYQEIKRLDPIGMRFAIFRNRKGESANSYELGGTRELRIVPVVSGSGVIQLLSPRLSGVKQSGAPENLTAYAFGSANNTPPQR